MTHSPQKKLTPEAATLLQSTYLRIQNVVAAERLWTRVFTEEERHRLGGDLEACYEKFKSTIGMWIALRHPSQDIFAEQAIIEVAEALGFLNPTDTQWLRREIGAEVPQPNLPSWDASTGKLLFGDEVIRKVRITRKPTKIQKILDAFQAAGWQTRIDNPMFRGGHYTPNEQQIRDAVYLLNDGLKRIRFHAQEGGRAVTWERS